MFQSIGNTDHISAWKSNGFSDKNIKALATSHKCFSLSLNHNKNRTRIKFDVQSLE